MARCVGKKEDLQGMQKIYKNIINSGKIYQYETKRSEQFRFN